MDVIGINAWDGPGAACLLRDGRIVAAAREDAFSRRPDDPAFPRQAIDYCLRAGKIGPTALSAAGLSGQERYPGDPSRAPRLLTKLGWGRGVDALGFVARELDPAVPVRAVARKSALAGGALLASPFERAAVLLLEPDGTTMGRAGRNGFRSLAEEAPATESTPEQVLRLLDAVRQAAECDEVVIGGSLAGGRSVLQAAHDAGGETWIGATADGGASALGAALESARGSADPGATPAGAPGRALGPGYNSHQVRTFLRSRDLRLGEMPRDDVAPRTAELLLAGHTVAWFAGRVALGPEALASRGVLSLSPGPDDIRAVAAAHAAEHFDLGSAARSPLAFGRPRDGGDPARILRIDPEAHRPLHAVLDALRAAGKPPVVAIRPLARPGEPIACTPRDAFDAFRAAGADTLVMERYLIPGS